MSDTPQGENWWQASDGKWYPPEEGSPASGAAGRPGGGAPAQVDIGQALSYGWNGFVKYIGAILVIWLVLIAVYAFFNLVPNVLLDRTGFVSIMLGFALTVIGWIVGFIVQLGLIRAALAITEGREPSPDMLFKTDNLGPYIVASILVGLMAFAGVFLCCIGALAVLFFTWFYGYFIVDRGDGPTDSIGASFNLVKDNLGVLAAFTIVAILLWAVTCGLAAPVVLIATAYVYKTMTGQQVAPVS